ncbi:Protein kinase cGMP-dependent at 21D [Carabus blaptoides fortunei]
MSCCCVRVMKFLGFKETVTFSTDPVNVVPPRPPVQRYSHVPNHFEQLNVSHETPENIPPPSSPPAVNERRPGLPLPPSKNLDDVEIIKYEKDKSTETLIGESLMRNEFLRNLLDKDRLQQVIDAMRMDTVQPKQYVIREGDTGAHLYVPEEGTFEVTKNDMIVNKMKAGETFGELAILYNTKRFASVQALTKGKLWVLDRAVFQKIMLRTAIEEYEANIDFLKKVPPLEGVKPEILNKISNLLKREFFSTGTVIVRQGDRGDKFYIIKVGSVLITKRTQESALDENVGTLRAGQFFGELALLKEDYRQATVTAQAPGVECLTLDRNNFIEYLGEIEELKKDYPTKPLVQDSEVLNRPDYSYIRFNDLVSKGTLGVGGFGRVDLMQHSSNKNLTFAMKYLKKVDIVEQQQQEHAYNEKMIMYSCNSEFICKLYKTYKDSKYIYFLMELCLGGDVWTLLQKQSNRCFDEKMAKFMTACVVEAFDYLHARDIIYRDLKPENLLIDPAGYIKLVDFGFSKKLGSRGKTYTFAGTPEYVAPEIILNRGHDKAVDYWALGIFIYELLVGKPPFRGSDHMKTYNLIIRGIDSIDYSPKVSKVVVTLVRRLCRSVPADRLGCQKNGVNDIREYKWFNGFNWEALRTKQMDAPYKPHIKNSTDISNFDKYPKDTYIPPDENSGWDNEL